MAVVFPKLSRVMLHDEFCQLCSEKMELVDHVPNLIEKYVDIFYVCKCGNKITFRYAGGHFTSYLDIITAPPKLATIH